MSAPTVSTVDGAIGQSPKRVEDDRFIRGKGNYVDDVQLPGMLFMAIYRSPFAHATINSIDTSRALAMPGVIACVTGQDLEAHGLAWMPTLAGDTQAVLATDKVRFQGQEVVCVIAKTAAQAEDAQPAPAWRPPAVPIPPVPTPPPGPPPRRLIRKVVVTEYYE